MYNTTVSPVAHRMGCRISYSVIVLRLLAVSRLIEHVLC